MTYVVTFQNAQPSAREDQPWTDVRIDESATGIGAWSTLETQALDPVDTDPETPAERDITTTLATLESGWYRLAFIDADDNQEVTAAVHRGVPAAFCTSADIEGRIGRELTEAEAAQVAALIPLATQLVEEAVGRDSDWSTDLDPIPAAVHTITIELVVRALLSPIGGTESETETLGAYSHTVRYATATGGLTLTEAEGRRLRKAVYGSNTASVRVGSAVDDIRSDILGLDLSEET